MLPMAFYFWIRLTNPENTSANIWSLRFLVALGILGLLGIFGFYLLSKGLPTTNTLKGKIETLEISNKEISNELENKNTELSKLKLNIATPSAKVKGTDTENLSVADLVVGTPNPGSAQRITGNVGISNIDVFTNPALTSPKIGTTDGSITYPYITKQNGWYKIVLTSTKTGWVNSDQVQELN